MTHHQAGRLAEAEALYRQVLAQTPNDSKALHGLGVLAYQLGRDEAAADLFRRAAKLNPADFESCANLGAALKALGRLEEAADACNRAIQINPSHAMAWRNLGVVRLEQKRIDEALAAQRKAVSLLPNWSEAYNNLGNALLAHGDLHDAVAAFQKTIALQPNHSKAFNNLGVALAAQNKPLEAIAAYRRATELEPGYAVAWSNLGATLKSQGQVSEALAAYQKLPALCSDNPNVHYNIGTVLADCGRFDDAIDAFRKAIGLKRDFADAWNNLGFVLKDVGLLDEAFKCFDRAIELNPSDERYRSNRVFVANYNPDFDSAAQLQEQIAWDERHGRALRGPPPMIRPRAGRRLRIGYVSPDFAGHVVGRNILPLLREHDHANYEIFCYSDVTLPDSLTEKFRQYADQWRDIANKDHEAVANQIRQDQIDILMDLSLHSGRNRLPVFARKPAPLQGTFAGYPGGTGLSAIDFRLTDPYLDPPGTDGNYVEKSIRLPHSFWCYDPAAMLMGLDKEPMPGSLPLEPNGYVTFGCMNNFNKINEGVLTLWAGVVRAVKDSRLKLLSFDGRHRQRTTDFLARHGIHPSRVEFLSYAPRGTYLRYFHQLDIGLDTVPYNGHTTTLDALWMGVPVVTLVGKTVVGRAGWSQLNNLGRTELAATDAEQYMQIAVSLADDISRLREYHATLRQRMLNSPLTDAVDFARAVEHALERAWDIWS